MNFLQVNWDFRCPKFSYNMAVNMDGYKYIYIQFKY